MYIELGIFYWHIHIKLLEPKGWIDHWYRPVLPIGADSTSGLCTLTPVQPVAIPMIKLLNQIVEPSYACHNALKANWQLALTPYRLQRWHPLRALARSYDLWLTVTPYGRKDSAQILASCPQHLNLLYTCMVGRCVPQDGICESTAYSEGKKKRYSCFLPSTNCMV